MVQIHSPGHSLSFALSKIGSKGFLLLSSTTPDSTTCC